MPISGEAQDFANQLVDAAQDLANSVIDMGEEAASVALASLVMANRLLGDALEKVSEALIPKQ